MDLFDTLFILFFIGVFIFSVFQAIKKAITQAGVNTNRAEELKKLMQQQQNQLSRSSGPTEREMIERQKQLKKQLQERHSLSAPSLADQKSPTSNRERWQSQVEAEASAVIEGGVTGSLERQLRGYESIEEYQEVRSLAEGQSLLVDVDAAGAEDFQNFEHKTDPSPNNNVLAAELRAAMKDPKSIRQAFILGEVLRRPE